MTISQIISEADPMSAPQLLPITLRALNHGAAMGFFIGHNDDLPISHDAIEAFLEQLAQENIAQDSLRILRGYLDRRGSLDAADLTRVGEAFERIYQALHDNPVPSREWDSLQRYFDADGLAELLGISKSSVLRYSRKERSTPDDVAARLHWLAIVVGYLNGTYNALGVRRWFARPRTALAGRSPQELLLSEKPWSPDGENAGRIEELARASAAMLAT